MSKLKIFLPDGPESIHEITEDVVTIGRLPDNTIRIDDASVSSHHAQLSLTGGEYHLKDLNSTNGTRVNGESVTEARLRAGDRVQFGKIEAVFEPEKGGAVQPLPEAFQLAMQPAQSSQRPADFTRDAGAAKAKAGDPVARGIIAFAYFAIAAFLAAMFVVFTLRPPQ
jgi:pSer/pThr/pTyr-binding forkhead associated (FHA) protein